MMAFTFVSTHTFSTTNIQACPQYLPIDMTDHGPLPSRHIYLLPFQHEHVRLDAQLLV